MNDSESPSECVILLHGLARTHFSMKRIEKKLQSKGYRVFNIHYPSRTAAISELSELAINQGLELSRQHRCQPIHFVTHSLGGILVRYYLKHHQIDNMGRVVMLGPPNQGSEAADRLKQMPGFRLLNGPAGMQLGTGYEGLPGSLGAVNFELGVIAGTRSLNPILSNMIPGQDDGKVSVRNTRVDGMKDFIELPLSHTFMMQDSTTITQVLHFLQHGHFDHTRH